MLGLMSEGDEHDSIRLREAEIAPERRTVAEMLERLPAEPGVYLMKDRRGKMLYIGKAANLRSRVHQYFQPASGDTRDFVPLLEGIVGSIETVVTRNEKEALLLENTLIKKHQPRFNVKLTDDKNYLSLRLDPHAEWPRLEVVRRMADDGAWYFGPYHSASACREALRVVNRHFRLRTCTDHVLHHRVRPCLQCQIKRCMGPCCIPVSHEEYAAQVRDVRLFLEGKDQELLQGLRTRMKEAASRTQFESAAILRDQIRALETVLQTQNVISPDMLDQDVVGYYREGPALEVVVMSVRQGKLQGSRAFSFARQEFPDDEILSSFLGLFYDFTPAAGASLPEEVLLPFAVPDAEVKSDWLSEKRGRKVALLVPQRGPRRDLLELARKNATNSFNTRRSARDDAEATLARLQRRLGLAQLPRTIECYDISHIQGAETVASMVVFVDGQPEKTRYRTFKVKRAESPDDFASMYEVLSRRFRRAREASAAGEEDSTWRLPELVVVDGGKGQLGVALAAARDVGIDVRPGTGLPIVALAKERDFAEAGEPEPADPVAEPAPPRSGENGKRPDRIFLPHAKDAIPIRPNSAEMFVLQRLRDEAHRFAVSFHRAQRRRRTLRSTLSAITGIGPGRQRELLRHFGSVKKIREASLDDLASVPGMTRTAATAVVEYFANHPATPAPETTPAPGAAASTDEAGEDAVDSAFAGVDSDDSG